MGPILKTGLATKTKMTHAPRWLLECFLRDVNKGLYSVLPTSGRGGAAMCWRGSTSVCLYARNGHRFHSPTICPYGRGLVWQPQYRLLHTPCITPIPDACIERFIRQHVLEPNLIPELVEHVMSFIETVHVTVIPTSLRFSHTSQSDPSDSNAEEDSSEEEEYEIHEPPIVSTTTQLFRVFNVERPWQKMKPYRFHSSQDMDSYFAKHNIRDLSEEEISQCLNDAVAEFEAVCCTPIHSPIQEPEVVDDDSYDDDSYGDESHGDDFDDDDSTSSF